MTERWVECAEELVRVARLLLADEYPMFAGKKVVKGFDIIRRTIRITHFSYTNIHQTNRY